jgi:signal transduction histidine kinase/membrane-bound lytic murein transglycosylase MltF/ActR/RegA family two-component response regulator
MTKFSYLSKDTCIFYRFRSLVVFLFLQILLLNSLFISSIHAQTNTATTKQKKTIRIGINESDAPFTLVLSNGRATGLFVDIWQTWADINDQVVVFVPMTHQQSIAQLKSGQIDMQAGLFINDERAKWADFSVAIAQVTTKLFYHDATTKKLSLAELSGLEVGVGSGTFQADYLINHYPEIIRVDLDLNTEEYFVGKLLNGELFAVLAEQPVMNGWLERAGLKGTIVSSQNAILTNTAHGMFRKDNRYLKSIVNAGFKNIPIATLRLIEKKWIPGDLALFRDYEIKLDNLTLYEQEWLATNLNFSLGISPSFMPLEWIDEKGIHQGVSADYVRIVKDKLSINMKPNLNLSWPEIIEAIKNKEVDVIPAIVKTKSRESFINFTKPYISFPLVIASNINTEQIQNLSDLKGEIVAVEKNSASEELLRRNHPNLILFPVDDALMGMTLLETKKVDAYVSALVVIVHHLNSGDFKTIEIAAYTDYKVDIAMGIRKGLEPLKIILDKALDSLTTKEKTAIYNSWLTVRIETGTNIITFVLWSLPILSFLMLIIFFVLRSNQILATEINSRQEVELKLIYEKANAEKANLAKDNFLANMSHEIRTPMNAVLGMSQVLSESGLTSEQKSHNDILYTSASALLSLLNDILDLSKIELGKIELDIQSFILKDVIDKIICQQQFLLADKDVLLSFNIDSSVQNSFKGDSFRLSQILINLINNAIKFTEQGAITLSIKPIKTEGSRFNIEFTISDTGIGMTNEEMNNIFDTYNQADSSTTRKYGGTGLGLSICRQLIELMGGTIRVVSTPGKGCCFAFNVILGACEQVKDLNDRTTKKESFNIKYQILRDKKVLVVDDKPVNIFVASSHLKNAGISVTTATNGQEAIDALKKYNFDAVIMDIQMPIMDGLDAARSIRNDLKLIDLPIIALSANVMTDDEGKSLNAGMNAHLGKPIDVDLLLSTLSSYIVKNSGGIS